MYSGVNVRNIAARWNNQQPVNNYNPQPPPNPYQENNGNNNGGGYIPNLHIGYNNGMNGYNPNNRMPPQPPPNVGYGIDDNPYSMDEMDIYNSHNPESEDSSGDQNNSDQPLSSNQQVDLTFQTPQIGSYQDSILPDIPEFPDMIHPKEMDLKPV